jgi:hypothetical protein
VRPAYPHRVRHLVYGFGLAAQEEEIVKLKAGVR